jgi:hypothetical protein
MTTEATVKTTGSKRLATDDAQDTLQAVMHEVRGALDGVRRSVPDVARASRAAAADMVAAMETGSDGRTQAGVTLSLGLALGMLLGGAPRLLVMLALGPVAAMALVLGDRRARQARSSAS